MDCIGSMLICREWVRANSTDLQMRVSHWLVPSAGGLKRHPGKNCLSVDWLREKWENQRRLWVGERFQLTHVQRAEANQGWRGNKEEELKNNKRVYRMRWHCHLQTDNIWLLLWAEISGWNSYPKPNQRLMCNIFVASVSWFDFTQNNTEIRTWVQVVYLRGSKPKWGSKGKAIRSILMSCGHLDLSPPGDTLRSHV